MATTKYEVGQQVKTPEGTGTVESVSITSAGIIYTVKEPVPTQYRSYTHPESAVSAVTTAAAAA